MNDFIYKSYFTGMQVKKDMKYNIRILMTVGIYHAFNDGSVVIIPILFPVFKTLFNLSYTQVGIITGGGLLITLLTQILIGGSSDRKNRRILLSVGMLLMSISLLLITQVKGFFTLLLFIFILRFSAGFFHPVGVGWISKTFKKERTDWAMGIQSASGDFGAFIAIISTAFIVEIKDWHYPFYIWTIIGIICMLMGLFLTRNIHDKYLINKNNRFTKSNPRNLFFGEWEMLKRTKIFLPGMILSGAAWGIVVSYLPLLLYEKIALSLSAIGIMISIWLGIGTIVCIFYGEITTIIGRKNIIILSYLTMGVMGFLLTIITNVIILIIIMILLGLSTFLTYPALFSYISEKTDETFEGKIFGYIFTIQLGAGTFLLFLCGVTADLWGIWTPFFILGIFSWLVTIILIFYRKNIMPIKS